MPASCALPSAQSVLLRPVVLQDIISGPDRRRRRCHRRRRHRRRGRRRHRGRRRASRRRPLQRQG